MSDWETVRERFGFPCRARPFRGLALVSAAAHRVGPRPGGNTQGDALEPTAERVLHPDGPGLASEHEESRLESILGGMLIAEHAAADAKDHRPMALYQHLECDLSTSILPVEKLRQQLGIRRPADRPQAKQLVELPEYAGLSVDHVHLTSSRCLVSI